MATARWFLTARNLYRAPVTGREFPFGTVHVRSPGDPFTACGEPALNWRILWDTPVASARDVCVECSVATSADA